MACRIRNTGAHVLHLDLRDGETIHLAPGQTSRPLREEHLYTNPYLAGWLRQGLAQRHEAGFREVLAWEGAATTGQTPEEAAEKLAKVHGIGPKTARHLFEEGIYTLEQLARCDPARLAGLRGWNEAKARQALEHAAELLDEQRKATTEEQPSES